VERGRRAGVRLRHLARTNVTYRHGRDRTKAV
jgi:hypothetical protein